MSHSMFPSSCSNPQNSSFSKSRSTANTPHSSSTTSATTNFAAMAECHCADIPPVNPTILINCSLELDKEVNALLLQVKEATAHAKETVNQAESQHLSHPSLYQRAYGTTVGNEPPGIHQLHWKHRSMVRDRQHKDEAAAMKLEAAYDDVRTRSSDIRLQVIPQHKESVKQLNSSETGIAQLRRDVLALQKIVSSREHVVGDGEGE